MIELIRSHAALALVGVVLALDSGALCAQRHYANSDVGRPMRVGDAVPESKGELEIRLPGFRLDQPDFGPGQWRLEPAVSLAIASRTSFELGASILRLGSGSQPRTGLSGLDVGMFHLVAAESHTRPAFGPAVDVFVPAGALRSGGTWNQVRGILTRTRGRTRLHVNSSVGSYRVELLDPGATCRASSLLIKLGLTCDGSSTPVLPGGPCGSVSAPAGLSIALVPTHCAKALGAFQLDTTIVVPAVIRPQSGVRWFSGLSADYDIRGWSTLLMADIVVSRLVGLQPAADWSVEFGARRQMTDRTVLDAGIARRFTGARPGWSFASGLTWSSGSSHAHTGR
jgi:hypothetical protein